MSTRRAYIDGRPDDNPDCLPRTAQSVGGLRAVVADDRRLQLDRSTVPKNEGSFRRIRVQLRESCVARHPAASDVLLARHHQYRGPCRKPGTVRDCGTCRRDRHGGNGRLHPASSGSSRASTTASLSSMKSISAAPAAPARLRPTAGCTISTSATPACATRTLSRSTNCATALRQDAQAPTRHRGRGTPPRRSGAYSVFGRPAPA